MKLARLFRARDATAREPLRLYLHIGLNKTGTTAIQHALAQNDALAREHGLLYPRTGRGRGKAHYLVSHHLGFSHHTPPLAREPGALDGLEPALRKEATEAGCRTVLISSEAFTIPGDIGRVRAFFADWDVRIVVYLRRHDHWWASSYSQGVRTVAAPRWPSGFEGYLEVQRRRVVKGDYRRIVDSWAAVFGAPGMIVRPYEREQNVPDIVADLLGAIGHGDLAPRLGPAPARNESLGERELVLIDAIQRAGLDDALRKRAIDAVRRRPGQVKGAGFIPPRLRRALVEENLEDYAYIARTYMGRADGVLFHEPLPDPDATWTPPAPATAREIAEALESAR